MLTIFGLKEKFCLLNHADCTESKRSRINSWALGPK